MQRYKINHFNPISIIFFLLISVLFSCNLTKNVPEDEQLLVKNEVQILNRHFQDKQAGFKEKDIQQILKPKPNSKLIWFPVPVKLAIYNLLKEEKVKKKEEKKTQKCLKRKQSKIRKKNKKLRLYDKKTKNLSSESRKYKKYVKKISKLQSKKDALDAIDCNKEHWTKRLGEAPVILKLNDKYRNLTRIKIFLQEKGFYNSDIHAEIKNRPVNKKKATVIYKIKLEEVHRIRKIVYDINDNRLKKYILKDTVHSLLRIGKRLDINDLDNERERIETRLRNLGFYNFSKEFIHYSVDTISKNKNDEVYLIIKNDSSENGKKAFKRYMINNVYIYPNFNANKALVDKNLYLLKHDTLIYYAKNDLQYYFLYNEMPRINPRALIKGIYIKPGQYFNLKDINASYRYLVSLPIIQIANVKFIEADRDVSSSDTVDYLDCEIRLTQSKLQNINTSFELTNTSENYGTGGTFFYTHNNFFRNTEVLNIGTKIAFKRLTKNKEWLQSDTSGFFNRREYGINFSLKFPRLMAPVPMKKYIKRRNTKTIISGNYNFLRHPDYTYTFAGGNIGYYWNSNNFTGHSFIPLTIDIVDLRNANADFLKQIESLRLKDSYETHFVLGSSYRFLLNNQFIGNKKNILYFSLYTKIAGNSLAAYMRWRNKPKTNGSYTINNIVFAQFVKEEAELRFYRKLSRENDKLAFRFFAGAALPYGNLKVIPYGERYYSGGANSIRAWKNRTLGPGSYSINDSINTFPDQTADIRLEANAEYRHKLFGKLDGALFLDAGNIWAINNQDIRPGAKFNINTFYKEIALGTGYGLRYDLSFVLLRVDMGIKLIDPSLPLDHRWIYGYRNFGSDDWTLSFAIVYPF